MSGIWPPAVGGPASHAPGLGAFLTARGHAVLAVTVGSAATTRPGFPLEVAPASGPLPVRMAVAAVTVDRAVRAADVVYATGLYHRTAAAARRVRRPIVMKLVNDPAYERAQGRGWFGGTLEEFQAARDPRSRALKAARDAAVRTAAVIVTPSRYLARIVEGWGSARCRVEVVPNPAPPVPDLPSREAARATLGIVGPTLVFAGRLVPQKDLPLAIRALRAVDGQVRLVVVGDGPERVAVERAADAAGVRDRIRFEAAVPRREVLTWLRAADAMLLPSAWENHPHVAVESLLVGTPVVGTAVGGVPEIVSDRSGILVPPGDAEALAQAIRTAVLDPEASARLRAGAAAVRPTSEEEVFGQLEELILAAAGR